MTDLYIPNQRSLFYTTFPQIRAHDNWADPFPLYPGEEAQAIHPMQVVGKMCALKLRAVRRFEDLETPDVAAGN